MAWGKKKEEPSRQQMNVTPGASVREESGQADKPATILGETLVVEGTITSARDMLIAGRVKGNLTCQGRVVISETGYVEGKIECKSIVIIGQVKGDINALEEITIESTGKLVGDISSKILTNHPGGFFEGYSHMIGGTAKNGYRDIVKDVKDSKNKKEKGNDNRDTKGN